MSEERQGWLRPRALRVAYLVQDGDDAHLCLDGIIADCYSRWGGRFSLIVPCQNESIPPSYWQWLENFDPDIIYSYVPLSEAAIVQLHERIAPAECLFHRFDHPQHRAVADYKPDFSFTPLSSLAGLFTMSRRRRLEEGPITMIDVWFGTRPSRHFADNFGTYSVSFGSSHLPPDAPAVRLLPVAPPEKVNRQHGFRPTDETLPDEKSALRIYADSQAISLASTSMWFSVRQEIRVWGWSDYFTLVIGDAVSDRVLFWNARLLHPTWLDGDLASYRIDEADLDDPERFDLLVTLLRRRNRVSNGSGGQTQIKVRSTSLSPEALEAACSKLRAAKTGSYVLSEALSDLAALPPPEKALKESWEGKRTEGFSEYKVGWTSFVWQAPTVRPPHISPNHLADVPPNQSFGRGWWMADLILEHDQDGPRYGGRNVWELSRRWRMTDAFPIERRQGDMNDLFPRTRASRGGRLSVALSMQRSLQAIGVPEASNALQQALVLAGRERRPDDPPDNIRPPLRTERCEDSNEARYLLGVVEMAGGLDAAHRFLLHPFLHDLFVSLGANPDTSHVDQTRLLNKLTKQALRTPTFDLTTDAAKQYLIDLVVAEARQLKKPMTFRGYDKLKADWNAHREKFWSGQPDDADPADVELSRNLESASLSHAIQALRRQRMLFQGIPWTCSACGHRNWSDLSAMAIEMMCEICRRDTPAPVEHVWQFRPNPFLVESLRDHSVLSLIWTLGAFRNRTSRSLIYRGPTKFKLVGFDDPREADLLVVADGRAHVCEVKNSWRQVTRAEVEKLVEVAKQLRPEVALLAVMEIGRAQNDALDKAKSDLANEDIGFELLTLDQAPLEDNPYLYTERA